MLHALLDTHAPRRIAFVGVAKNAGKTTALAGVLDAWERAGHTPALLSIGVDGERADAFSGAAKPRISAARDTLLATAEEAIPRGSAAFALLQGTGISSPLGEVFVARVTRTGDVLLAGLRQRSDVAQVCDLLEAHGATHLLIDGAFDRLAAADPTVCDAVVLSTGMVLDPDPHEVARQTAGLYRRLTLPQAPPSLDALARAAVAGQVMLAGPDGLRDTGLNSVIAYPEALAAAVRPTDTGLSVPGLLSTRVVQQLLALSVPSLDIVVPDATRVLCPPHWLSTLARRGRRLWVAHPMRVLAITANPHAPGGRTVASQVLLDALAAALPQVDLLDARTGQIRHGNPATHNAIAPVAEPVMGKLGGRV